MSKEDDRGLLSRVVRFVRNPSVSWSDLDQSDLDPESRYSKQMLKDMIERRRRNDFVRKREFDMLRRLRRDSLAGAQEAARPSFFHSSNQNKPDERAKTIKKIDEIEAQMSQQWWKTKHGEGEGASGGQDNPNTDFSVSFPDQQNQSDFRGDSMAGPRTQRPTRQRMPSGPPVVPSGASSNFASTTAESRPPPAPSPAPEAKKPQSNAIRMSQIGGLAGSYDGQVPGFTNSKLNAFQVGEFVHDPQLEEAAIRFANGDDDGAEAALLEALANPDPAVNGNQTIWMTLFDLYRATDRQESFENISLDFANRFGLTAPMWFSIPGSAKKHHTTVASQESSELAPHWTSPVLLELRSLALLNAALDRNQQPWCLNWSALSSIDDSALEALHRLFTGWTDQSCKLRFFGTEHLMSVLKSGTKDGDRSVNPLWWRIRMQALRIMHRPDEFEVVAMDYCVTYEVSPPSWDSALCNFKSMDGNQAVLASPTIISEPDYDGTHSSLSSEDFTDTERTAIAALGGHVSAVDLSGHIMGDAVEMLDTLNAQMESSDVIIVLCARLIRLDFLAAGTLLNWVSARQAEGRQVQFKDLHRLVAVFFNVIGINEHAKVIARTD